MLNVVTHEGPRLDRCSRGLECDSVCPDRRSMLDKVLTDMAEALNSLSR